MAFSDLSCKNEYFLHKSYKTKKETVSGINSPKPIDKKDLPKRFYTENNFLF